MRKGITPIISIIILLLITIGLAASAYTFMSGYFGTMTGTSIQVSGVCVGGTNDYALITVTNIGTASIDLGTGCSGTGAITEVSKKCGDVTVTRTDGTTMNADFSADSISKQDSVTFSDEACDAPNECTYAFTTPGMVTPQTVIIRC